MIRRTTEYCRNRISELVNSNECLEQNDVKDYYSSNLRRYWMPDSVSVDCYDCNAKFNAFRRKHHCRVCGQIFCSSCCSIYIDGKDLGFAGKLRVCKFCYDFFDRFLKGEEPGATPESLASLGISETTAASSPSGGSSANFFCQTVGSVFSSIGVIETEFGTVEEFGSDYRLTDSKQLRKLWIKITDSETGIEGSESCIKGLDLVNWLVDKDESMGINQAIAIGQALLDANYYKCVDRSKPFLNDETEYVPCYSLAGESSEPEEVPEGPEWLQNVQAPSSIQSSLQEDEKGSDNEDISESAIPFSHLEDITQSTMRKREASDVVDQSKALDLIYETHLLSLVTRHMKQERLNPKWRTVILQLVQKVVGIIKLDGVHRNDSMDVRNYAKIKRIPYGRMNESGVICGEIFQNSVIGDSSDKLMNPKVMLLRGSIAYNRTKYTPLENLSLQEEEYLKNICSKIKSLSPDLLLVEHTVCYKAKEFLSTWSIRVIQNVKVSILERVSRFLQSPIINSLDTLVQYPPLGKCDVFFSKSYEMSTGLVSPNYCILEKRGSKTPGCTILIRGASLKELKKVKRVLSKALLIVNHAQYEKAFLENENVKLNSDQRCLNRISSTYSLSPFYHEGSQSEDEFIENTWDYDFDELLPSNENLEFEVEPISDFNDYDLFYSLILHSKGSNKETLEDYLANLRASLSEERPITKPKYPLIFKKEDYENNTKKDSSYAPFLPVLFSSHSGLSKAFPNYCVIPWIVNMTYYGANDLTLGSFLETFCLSDYYNCPNRLCSTPMKDHIRRFVLDSGIVQVYIQTLSEPIFGSNSGEISTWKYCLDCEKLGSVVELTERSWHYSFAGFLSLLVYENSLRGGDQPCSHSIHHRHYTCFSRGIYVASFKYSELHPFSLSFPPTIIRMNPYIPSKESVISESKESTVKGFLVFEEIYKKMTETENHESIKDLFLKYDDQFKEYRSLVDKVQALIGDLDTSPSTLIALKRRTIALNQYLTALRSDWTSKLTLHFEQKKKEEKLRSRTSSGNHSDTISIADKPSNEESVASRNWNFFNSNEILLTNHFSPSIHYGLPSPNYIIVDETQPSSIIAYVLASGEYMEYKKSSDSESVHFEHDFSDGESAKFYCIAYYAKEFEQIREKAKVSSDDYLNALAECNPWKGSGGKSGLTFFKTNDDRFILKQMSPIEVESFPRFAESYFQYIGNALNEADCTSLLAKIIGVYKIGFKSSTTKKSLKLDVLVIENIFYGRNILEKYDLKGSMRNRHVDIPEGRKEGTLVLLDENLLKNSCEKPLFIKDSGKKMLLEAIERDTSFLFNAAMMDYSLLVGIDQEKNELVLGIIDYIRLFTWDKKLETLIKKTGILGGSGQSPTIIPPKIYKKRFIDAMHKYFIVLPENSQREDLL